MNQADLTLCMWVCVCVQTWGNVASAGDGTETRTKPHWDDGRRHGRCQMLTEWCICVC